MNKVETIVKEIKTHIPARQTLTGQFVRYLVTGGLAFVVDFLLFAFFLYKLEWYYLFANFIGLLAGLVLNYIMSVVWVFSECKRDFEEKKTVEFGVFAVIGFLGVGLNQLLMYLMVDGAHMNEMLSKMIAAVLVLLWNFGARKIMLFSERKSA